MFAPYESVGFEPAATELPRCDLAAGADRRLMPKFEPTWLDLKTAPDVRPQGWKGRTAVPDSRAPLTPRLKSAGGAEKRWRTETQRPGRKLRTQTTKMATPKQIAANRRNAQKSTGPNTPAGKQIVAKNAVRHGFLCTNPILSPEEQEEFNQFASAFEDDFQPQGLREGLLISRIADLHWRLRRVAGRNRHVPPEPARGQESGVAR
jgi:hypothetical protein